MREPLPAQEEAEAAAMLRTQPCLALKPHSIPHPRTTALLWGGERTSDGPQHRFLGLHQPSMLFLICREHFPGCLQSLDQPNSHLRDSEEREPPPKPPTPQGQPPAGKEAWFI